MYLVFKNMSFNGHEVFLHFLICRPMTSSVP